jgi:hypothetical protein
MSARFPYLLSTTPPNFGVKPTAGRSPRPALEAPRVSQDARRHGRCISLPQSTPSVAATAAPLCQPARGASLPAYTKHVVRTGEDGNPADVRFVLPRRNPDATVTPLNC